MISVIGGSGFIGTRLCKRLTQHKNDFVIMDKKSSFSFPDKLILADIRSINELRQLRTDCSVIINLAAEHRDDVKPKKLYDEVNVDGAKNICQLARENDINFIIFTSSVAVYGFASPGTDESGEINYFNDYGRTKYLAENVYKKWLEEDPINRTLVIIRPTVVFGEQNRGNVYNLLRQIATGKFIMLGDGKNKKSMAYVENIASFIEHCFTFPAGLHIYNYIDKPDMDMNMLVRTVKGKMGRNQKIRLRIPYLLGLAIGYLFDLVALIVNKPLSISSIRIKKFCATTQFDTSIASTGFTPPVKLSDALEQTIQYEFFDHKDEKNHLLFTE